MGSMQCSQWIVLSYVWCCERISFRDTQVDPWHSSKWSSAISSSVNNFFQPSITELGFIEGTNIGNPSQNEPTFNY